MSTSSKPASSSDLRGQIEPVSREEGTEPTELELRHPWNCVYRWLDQGAVYVRAGGQWLEMGEQMMRDARQLEKSLTMYRIPPPHGGAVSLDGDLRGQIEALREEIELARRGFDSLPWDDYSDANVRVRVLSAGRLGSSADRLDAILSTLSGVR